METILALPARKVSRSITLFAEAQKLIRTWSDENPIKGKFEATEDRKQVNLVLDVDEDAPLDNIALIVGDAIHNLRSALDGLAWQLAHMREKPAKPRQIYFPVAETKSQWKNALSGLATVPEPALERIKSFQPFNFPNPAESFLGILHHLDIKDKHHDFLVAKAQIFGAGFENLLVGLDAGTEVTQPKFAPQLNGFKNSILASMSFTRPIWPGIDPGGNVQVAGTFVLKVDPLDVYFSVDEIAEKFPPYVMQMLEDICDVRRVSSDPAGETEQHMRCDAQRS